MTLEDIKSKLTEIKTSMDLIHEVFNISALETELKELESAQSEPDFFSDPKRMESVGKRIAETERKIALIKSLDREYGAIDELSKECKDDEHDIIAELTLAVRPLEAQVEDMRLTALFSGKHDGLGAILSVQSGAGGTEAQDWAEMLLRMYQRYAEKRGFKTAIIDIMPGEEAGIKSATVRIDGENAYGYLKAERGVHRLVRISPFDSNSRRHTSFASVEVMPQIENDNEIEIKESDLKIDTFHAGGSGGQHVNTTDSAVRIKHIPTGIVVQCRNERSQIQNREGALRVLRARLAQFMEEQQQKDINALQGTLKKIEWGSQIRSYVFYPYTLVKDHRTDYETSNVEAVMDGDLQPFINEFLRKQNAKN